MISKRPMSGGWILSWGFLFTSTLSCSDANGSKNATTLAGDVGSAVEECDPDQPQPIPDLDSEVMATAVCLTAGSSARSLIRVDLRDMEGLPISGANVLIEEETGEGRTWQGQVVESQAVPGTYYRVMQAPPEAGATTVIVAIENENEECSGSRVTLNTSVVISFAEPAQAGTGGCPLDHNLRVTVIEADTGAPVPDAYVMVGQSAATPFEDDFESLLSGEDPIKANHGRTDEFGVVEFSDHGGNLSGHQLVTAGADGYAYFSLVAVNAADVVMPLSSIQEPPPSSQVDGHLVGFDDPDYTDYVEAGLVMPQLSMQEVARFTINDMIASEMDCWMVTDAPVAGGEKWVAFPSVVYVPSQTERKFFFKIPIYEHRFKTKPVVNGTPAYHHVGLYGRIPFDDLIDAMGDGGDPSQVIGMLETTHIGVYTTDHDSDQHDVALDVSTPLNRNVSCTVGNTPDGATPFCVTLGDWDGGAGDGPMFVMGLSAMDEGQAILTSVEANGDFSGIGYVGLGLATYLDAESLPEEEHWRLSASVKRLNRTSGAFDGSGGSLQFDDFLNVTPLYQQGSHFSFNAVDTVVAVDYSEHRLELVSTITHQPGPECDPVQEAVWRSTYWQVLAPGAVLEFSLPELPDDWPRQTEGGLAIPDDHQHLTWSFSAYHLGLVEEFDFDRFDFPSAQASVTHSSSNSQEY